MDTDGYTVLNKRTTEDVKLCKLWVINSEKSQGRGHIPQWEKELHLAAYICYSLSYRLTKPLPLSILIGWQKKGASFGGQSLAYTETHTYQLLWNCVAFSTSKGLHMSYCPSPSLQSRVKTAWKQCRTVPQHRYDPQTEGAKSKWGCTISCVTKGLHNSFHYLYM